MQIEGNSGLPEKRLTNIELLRIVAMLLIVAYHFAYHGEFSFPTDSISINRLWFLFLLVGGKFGVNIFVLISGYFLINVDRSKTQKVIKLWLEIFVYSVCIYCCFCILGFEVFNLKEFLFRLFPITSSEYLWFSCTYFVFYLIAPYIGVALKNFEKKQYIQFLLVFGILWCILPTFTGRSLQSNNLLWFIYLYAVAGYLRLFQPLKQIKAAKSILLSLFMIMISFASSVLFAFLGIRHSFFSNHTTFFYGMQSLPIFFASIFLFNGFTRIQIKYSRPINAIASTCFGVYLIHDNPLVRHYLWAVFFKVSSYQESNYLIPYSLLVVFLVFAGCSIIDFLRIHTVEKIIMPLIKTIANAIDNAKAKLIKKIESM